MCQSPKIKTLCILHLFWQVSDWNWKAFSKTFPSPILLSSLWSMGAWSTLGSERYISRFKDLLSTRHSICLNNGSQYNLRSKQYIIVGSTSLASYFVPSQTVRKIALLLECFWLIWISLITLHSPRLDEIVFCILLK